MGGTRLQGCGSCGRDPVHLQGQSRIKPLPYRSRSKQCVIAGSPRDQDLRTGLDGTDQGFNPHLGYYGGSIIDVRLR